jgi:cysteine desulfurase
MASSSPRPSQVYLDCNATTPCLPQAADAAMHAMRLFYGNPSSTHASGLQAKHILESTRAKAAQAVGAHDTHRIVFTSGATEGIHIAVFSAFQHIAHQRAQGLTAGHCVLYGATEHKAVPQALAHWNQVLHLNLDILPIPVDAHGQHNLAYLQSHAHHAVMVCTMAVNNETGVVSDLTSIQNTLNACVHKPLWLVDGVQALGKLPLNLDASMVDYACFSGHKLYAPKGIGFLYVKQSAPFTPLMVGGGQERGMRSGTENLPGVAALGAVLEALIHPHTNEAFATHETLEHYRNMLVEALKQAFEDVVFNTPFEHAVPTTLNFAVPNMPSKDLISVFDAAGVRMSAGSACSSGKSTPSDVLNAMGVPAWQSTNAIRLSFGPGTRLEEIQRGCKAIAEAAQALKDACHLIHHRAHEAPETLRDGVIQYTSPDFSNTWLVCDKKSKTCVIIDPTEHCAEKIVQFVECQQLKVLAVLDTHSHADHTSCRPFLHAALRTAMVHAPEKTDALGWPTGQGCLQAGAVNIKQVNTPGHTQDSVGYVCSNIQNEVLFVFTGDTVLMGGLGRTDFPTSNVLQLRSSVRTLDALCNPFTVVCPAHDYTQQHVSTWLTEKTHNTLLKQALNPHLQDTDFVAFKSQHDTHLVEQEHTYGGMVCGVTNTCSSENDTDVQWSCQTSTTHITQTPSSVEVIDVREPSEFVLCKDWDALGLKEPPRNVPLSRLANYVSEKIRQPTAHTVLVVCQSGARSLRVAKALRHVGLQKVFSIQGGMAFSVVEWT